MSRQSSGLDSSFQPSQNLQRRLPEELQKQIQELNQDIRATIRQNGDPAKLAGLTVNEKSQAVEYALDTAFPKDQPLSVEFFEEQERVLRERMAVSERQINEYIESIPYISPEISELINRRPYLVLSLLCLVGAITTIAYLDEDERSAAFNQSLQKVFDSVKNSEVSGIFGPAIAVLAKGSVALGSMFLAINNQTQEVKPYDMDNVASVDGAIIEEIMDEEEVSKDPVSVDGKNFVFDEGHKVWKYSIDQAFKVSRQLLSHEEIHKEEVLNPSNNDRMVSAQIFERGTEILVVYSDRAGELTLVNQNKETGLVTSTSQIDNGLGTSPFRFDAKMDKNDNLIVLYNNNAKTALKVKVVDSSNVITQRMSITGANYDYPSVAVSDAGFALAYVNGGVAVNGATFSDTTNIDESLLVQLSQIDASSTKRDLALVGVEPNGYFISVKSGTNQVDYEYFDHNGVQRNIATSIGSSIRTPDSVSTIVPNEAISYYSDSSDSSTKIQYVKNLNSVTPTLLPAITISNAISPTVAPLSNGKVAAVYLRGGEIYSTVYNDDLTNSANEAKLGTFPGNYAIIRSIADASGGFYVAGFEIGGSDGDGRGVFSAHFDSSLNVLSSAKSVQQTAGTQLIMDGLADSNDFFRLVYSTDTSKIRSTLPEAEIIPVISGPVTLPSANEDETENTTFTKLQLLANTDYPNLDDLFITGLSASQGSLRDNGDNTWTFIPSLANFNGDIVLNYAVFDGKETSVATSANLAILAVDDKSQITATTPNVAKEDEVGIVSGQISVSDVDVGDNPSFADIDNFATPYGNLTMINGNWNFTVNNEAKLVQELGEGEVAHQLLTFVATDGNAINVTVAINGTDDASIISQDFSSVLIEDDLLNAQGSMAIDDIDKSQNPFFPNISNIKTPYGNFTMSDGDWNFKLDNEAQIVQGLSEGEVRSQNVTVVASDGNVQNIEFTIIGTNDLPIVTGHFVGDLQEDKVLNATGIIRIEDVDIVNDPQFQDFTAPMETNNKFGTVTLVDGQWLYRLNNTAVQYLNEGQQVADSFELMASDDTKQNIIVNISGTADAPVITGNFQGNLVEDLKLSSTGNVQISDIDANDNPQFVNITDPISGRYGGLTLKNGQWNYALNNTAAQRLSQGQQAIDIITIEAINERTGEVVQQNITLRISGRNDAAIIEGQFSGAVQEDVILSAFGGVTISDVDDYDNPQFANITTPIKTQYGEYILKDNAWQYFANNTKLQILGEGEEVTDSFILTADDGSSRNVEILIAGKDDKAVVTGKVTDNLQEDVKVLAFGDLVIMDIDKNNNPKFNNTGEKPIEGDRGTISILNNRWQYALNNTQAQALDEGEVIEDVITLTATDGTKQNITLTIFGSADNPEITSSTTVASLVEEAVKVGDIIANVTASDLDQNSLRFLAPNNTNVEGLYEIDPVTGIVRLTQNGVNAVNRDGVDAIAKLPVTIMVSDGSSNSTITVNVDVARVNDNAPKIDTANVNTLTEEAITTETVVAVFSYHDIDGDNVSFNVTSGDDNGYFIFGENGELKLTPDGVEAINRDGKDAVSTIALGVRAFDGTYPSDVWEFNIDVERVNDNAPVFDLQDGLEVINLLDESKVKNGMLVRELNATDLDWNPISYQIITGNENNYFTTSTFAVGGEENRLGIYLTNAGAIAINNDDLNLRTLPLEVEASDGIHKTTVKFNVEINRDNPDAPIIKAPTPVIVLPPTPVPTPAAEPTPVPTPAVEPTPIPAPTPTQQELSSLDPACVEFVNKNANAEDKSILLGSLVDLVGKIPKEVKVFLVDKYAKVANNVTLRTEEKAEIDAKLNEITGVDASDVMTYSQGMEFFAKKRLLSDFAYICPEKTAQEIDQENGNDGLGTGAIIGIAGAAIAACCIIIACAARNRNKEDQAQTEEVGDELLGDVIPTQRVVQQDDDVEMQRLQTMNDRSRARIGRSGSEYVSVDSRESTGLLEIARRKSRESAEDARKREGEEINMRIGQDEVRSFDGSPYRGLESLVIDPDMPVRPNSAPLETQTNQGRNLLGHVPTPVHKQMPSKQKVPGSAFTPQGTPPRGASANSGSHIEDLEPRLPDHMDDNSLSSAATESNDESRSMLIRPPGDRTNYIRRTLPSGTTNITESRRVQSAPNERGAQ